MSKPDPPREIVISYDRLRLIVRERFKEAAMRDSWAIPLGIAATLWIDLTISDFSGTQKRFGLTASEWKLVLTLAALVSTAWTIFALWRRRSAPTADQVIDELVANSEMADEHRALFVMKTRDLNGMYRLAVFRDHLWHAYMLPHMNIRGMTIQASNDPALCNYLNSFIAIPASEMRIQHFDDHDLTSRKYSDFHKRITDYSFSFYLVLLPTLPPVKSRKFIIGGRAFELLTLDEMEADPETRSKNLDVTRHLLDHFTAFFSSCPNSFEMERRS